jgi:glycerophosphoryl diester phosphodiesterase
MLIIGHRGARAVEPENTLRALRRGVECADLVEIDLRLTWDGIPVAIHDATVDRTTDGIGPVKGFRIEELKRLDAGEGEQIPTLREVLDLVHGRAGLVAEIKEPGTEEIICSAILDKLPEPLFLVSFHHGSVESAKRLLPGATVGLIYSDDIVDPVGVARSLQADALLPRWHRTSPALVHEAHEAGLLVVPWTLNGKDEIAEAVRMGVDGFASDDPCAARRFLQGALGGRKP